MDERTRAYVEDMIRGDEPAFDNLYRSYSGKLYRMAFFITGDKYESEDILQETFVKCFLHRNELRNPERFESWIYRILVRTAWKTGKKKRELSLDEIVDRNDASGLSRSIDRDDQAGPLELVMESETASELMVAVKKLDQKYRTVVLLYYYNELGTKEIARITGLFEGTVKSRLFKARKLLRESLETGQWAEERGVCHE